MFLQSSKGSKSCSDVKPRFAWNHEEVSAGFACSHGTVIFVTMTPQEAIDMYNQLGAILEDLEASE